MMCMLSHNSNHFSLLINGGPHSFQSFVHGAAVEGKNVHILLHLCLRLPLPLTLLHHALQPLYQFPPSVLAPLRLRSHWSLLPGGGGRGGLVVGLGSAHLEVVLAFLEHAHVLALGVEVERFLLQLLL